jgi:hypothetical protein
MTEMKKKPNTVYDSKGAAYTFSLADEIGSGGQGKVGGLKIEVQQRLLVV